jgi:nicotinate-nucleotide adenylyltransferase
MPLGIFGGSFDPVHRGHLVVAREAAERLALSRVHLIPAYEQPFKVGAHHASPAHRLAMLRLAVEGDPRFVADAIEIDRGGVSYAIDTLRAFRTMYPEEALSLLVGADAAADLADWKDATEVAQLARVVVLTRPGTVLPDRSVGHEILDVPAVDVSATEVRRRVAMGEPIDGLVPPVVAQYIAAHGLYRTEDAC